MSSVNDTTEFIIPSVILPEEPAMPKKISHTPNLIPWSKTHPDVVSYWTNVVSAWPQLYPKIFSTEGKSILNYLQSLLPESMSDKIELELLFGEMNKQELPAFVNEVELYISPRHTVTSIPIMQALYEGFPGLQHLHVCKYKTYHPQDQLIAEIDFGAFKASYDDFGFQGSFGYTEEKKPVMNITIVVNQPLASKILEKRQVWFKNPNTQQTTSREIWASRTSNAIDLFLLNILGEYNLIHHIGYIELLPSDDPLITDDSVFTELSDIKKSIELIISQYHYKSCNYCCHNELQTDMKICSNCNIINYCSMVCQKADWKNHKINCQPPDKQSK
jgi:hypothetical protein